MALIQCTVCRFKYDEWDGDAKNGVPAGTPFTMLAGSLCSRCGMQGVRHERQPSPSYRGLEAQYYDFFAGKAGIPFYRDWLAETAGPSPILELGVGTARLTMGIVEKIPSVCGVDWSPEMLQIARRKCNKLFGESSPKVELIEADALTFESDRSFSHILCTDGFLQHFTDMDEHVSLLQQVRKNLREDGWIAVDLILPPVSPNWSFTQRKSVRNETFVYKHVNGETSLRRQLFRCSITYECFKQGMEQERYRVEREYALMTPKELGLLLIAEGFQIIDVFENYGLSVPWQSATFGGGDMYAPLFPSEELAEVVDERPGLQPYNPEAWFNGGYPFDSMKSLDSSTRFTLIAKVR